MNEKPTLSNAYVSAIQAGKRLDVFLAELCGFSRRESRRLCEGGLIAVNGHSARRGHILRAGDLIKINESYFSEISSDNRQDAIQRELERVNTVYEDSEMVVVSKPRLMHSVSQRANPSISLADCVIARYPDIRDLSPRWGEALLVQRLDYYTSGVVLAGRRPEVKEKLSASLSIGEISKSYLALLSGELLAKETVVDADIFLVPNANRVFLESQGKRSLCVKAHSVFAPLCYLNRLTKTDATIEESRSVITTATLALVSGQAMRRHQVRVHAKHLGHPLVGDITYLEEPSSLGEFFPSSVDSLTAEGFFLHAFSLDLKHPKSGCNMRIVDKAKYIEDWFGAIGINIWSQEPLCE